MNIKNRLSFRAFFKGKYIYKNLTDNNYYDSKNNVVNISNEELNELYWEQFIGIKDINGKLIYEGDLFKVFDDIISAEVIWDDKTASYKVKMLFNSDEWHMNYGGYYEDEISDLSDWLDQPIIGNANENPELIGIVEGDIIE